MKNHLSWSIIKRFSLRKKFYFTSQDVALEFPETNRDYLFRILANMVGWGMLCKITRNNYHIIPLTADPETYVPDGHLVVKSIMQNKEYYIAYTSALKIHGIFPKIEDKNLEARVADARIPESKVYVVTKEQMKPSLRCYRGITIHFIQHDWFRFFGYENIYIRQHEEAMVSSLERTLVDIASKPQLCGGIITLGYGLFTTKDRVDHETIFFYLAHNRNKSARKRFLYLSDLLGLNWTDEHDRMMEELGSSISLLDPSAPDRGTKWSKFGLKINVDPDLIKQKVLNG